jgi:hypothetical protein
MRQYVVVHTITHVVEAPTALAAVDESRSILDDEYWHRHADANSSSVVEVRP